MQWKSIICMTQIIICPRCVHFELSIEKMPRWFDTLMPVLGRGVLCRRLLKKANAPFCCNRYFFRTRQHNQRDFSRGTFSNKYHGKLQIARMHTWNSYIYIDATAILTSRTDHDLCRTYHWFALHVWSFKADLFSISYDLHDLAHAARWDLYNLHDLQY